MPFPIIRKPFKPPKLQPRWENHITSFCRYAEAAKTLALLFGDDHPEHLAPSEAFGSRFFFWLCFDIFRSMGNRWETWNDSIYIILILICLYYMLDWSPFPVNSGQMKVEPGSPPGPKTIATEPKKCQNPGGVGLTRGRGDNPKLFRMGFKLSLLRITRMLLERWNSGRNGQLRLHPDLGIRKVCFLGSTL